LKIPSYAGCKRLQLSLKAIDSMLAEGMSVAETDAAKKLALIVDERDRVVTVIKIASCCRRVRAKRTHPRSRFNR